MYKVIFQFENNDSVESYANEGENLLEVARKSNVAIDAPCFEFQEDTPYYRRGICNGMAAVLLQYCCRRCDGGSTGYRFGVPEQNEGGGFKFQ